MPVLIVIDGPHRQSDRMLRTIIGPDAAELVVATVIRPTSPRALERLTAKMCHAAVQTIRDGKSFAMLGDIRGREVARFGEIAERFGVPLVHLQIKNPEVHFATASDPEEYC